MLLLMHSGPVGSLPRADVRDAPQLYKKEASATRGFLGDSGAKW